MKIRKGFLLLFSLCLSLSVQAQETIASAVDKEQVKKEKSEEWIFLEKKPTKAMLLSAVLPGAGQFYNEQKLKSPIVLALFGAGVGYVIYQNRVLNRYKDIFEDEKAGRKHEFSDLNLSLRTLARIRDKQQRTRDYGIAVTVLIYVLNIADAYVGAHLFDISKDKDLTLTPAVQVGNQSLGFALNYRF